MLADDEDEEEVPKARGEGTREVNGTPLSIGGHWHLTGQE